MGISVLHNSIGTLQPAVLRSASYPAAPSNLTVTQGKSFQSRIATVTALAYAGTQVTLTAANTFAVGDRIEVWGVNGGFAVTNVDGAWICKAGTNSSRVVFDVAVQPTGTTPQTITAGSIGDNPDPATSTTWAHLSWRNNATNQKGFLIQRHLDAVDWNGVWDDLIEIDNTSAKNATVVYDDLTALVAYTYYYQVLAVNRT